MPLSTQVKLLRVLQEGEIQKLGGQASYKIDVRIIAATNRDLYTLVEARSFREDLYYRINVMNIHLPALRDRHEDITIIAHYVLNKLTNRAGKRVTGFSEEVKQLFLSYHWPGNIRELENFIQSAIFLTNSEVIEREDLPKVLSTKTTTITTHSDLKTMMKQTERQIIEQSLQDAAEKKIAAKQLGISLSTLYEKIKEHAL